MRCPPGDVPTDHKALRMEQKQFHVLFVDPNRLGKNSELDVPPSGFRKQLPKVRGQLIPK